MMDMNSERKMQFESGEAGVPEQRNSPAAYQLEELSQAVLDAVSVAASPDYFLCGIPLYSDGLYPDGIQKEQYHSAALVCGLG